MLWQIIIAGILIMLGSLIGVLTLWRKIGLIIEKKLPYLVSFSAGVFLVIAYSLATETIEISASPNAALGWIFLGAVGVWLVFKFLPSFHHHHQAEPLHDCAHNRLDARRIMLGDALHNVGDGILLVAAFAVSSTFGWLTAFSILLHEILQEISEFFVLKQAGYSSREAIIRNFIISSTILLGAIGSYLFLGVFEHLEGAILGMVSGVFLVVVLQDLIPETVRSSRRNRRYIPFLITFIMGVGLMTVMNMTVGHFHADEISETSHSN